MGRRKCISARWFLRGVRSELKQVTLVLAALCASLLVGCSSAAPADEGTVKPGNGVALNPGGKPKADQAAMANQMQKTGDAMNAQREKDAAAMAAAQARAGGK